MAATEIYLNRAGSNAGTFTGYVEGSSAALFTTAKGVTGGLATVDPAYNVTARSDVTLIDGSLTTHGWTIAGGAANATLRGGDYNDRISVSGGQTVYTGLGKDTVDVSSGTKETLLADYNYASDVIYVGTSGGFTTTSITTAGLVSVGGKAVAQLNATGGYYKAVLKADNDGTVYFWKGSNSAQKLDGSAETQALFMVAGTSSDTLMGGKGADTILTSSIAGAYAMGGAGNDSIVLGAGAGADKQDSIRQFVGISSSSGKDTVTNFQAGFADSDDVLVLTDGTIENATFTYEGGSLVVKTGNGQASLAGVNTGNLLMRTGTGAGEVAKVAVVDPSIAAIPATSDNLAAYYVSTGKKGQVDFTGISDDVVVELSNLGNYKGGAVYAGIDSVVGGDGNSTLVGTGATTNYLQAGKGGAALWGGGASKDYLQGRDNVADKFYVAQNDGKDTIQGFGTGVDAETTDVLYMLNSPAASLKNDGTNITITYGDGSAAVLAGKGGTSGGAENAVRFTTDGSAIQTAVIGHNTKTNAFGYSSDVNMYFAGSATDDALTVDGSYDASSVDIRLNNTLPQTYSSVERVNAAAYTGNAFLSGSDEGAEKLVGSMGKTTMWGGLGAANDTLEGTAGDVTSFYFGKNNGADVITASDSDDKIVFYDYANTDLAAIDTTGDQLKFTFTDGSSIQVKNYVSSSVQTFEFTNSSWTYDKATGVFTQTK